jgi:glyoxylase-like metal-dependent hydrolase (beta-lactamase superfamily II)
MKTNLQKITKDIYQVRLPLPFALDHVCCYLLRGDDGWTILDAGLNLPQIRTVWETTFATLNIAPGDIHQIIITHVHPDHYGLAGWLQEWCGAPVRMSPREAELARLVWRRQNPPETMADLFEYTGVPGDVGEKASLETKKMRKLTRPHPHKEELLEPETILTIGQRRFVIIHAPGHSDGQLIFYDADDQLLLSGDQVLIKITPNIGLWPLTEPDPLGRYLTSLQELSALDVRLALPGHGPVITDWRGRLAELQQHHADRLEKVLAAVNADGVTPYHVSQQIFKRRELTMHEIRFAVVEMLAHLEYLVNQEQLRREENGVWLYRHP